MSRDLQARRFLERWSQAGAGSAVGVNAFSITINLGEDNSA